MKKLFSILALCAVMALLITSCQKEQDKTSVTFVQAEAPLTGMEIRNLDTDELFVPVGEEEEVAAMPMPRDPVALGPDLLVTFVTSNLPLTGLCGVQVGAPLIPNITCNGQVGGSIAFQLTAVVTNVGNVGVPAGNLELQWMLVGSGQNTLTQAHNGIPPGGTVTFVANYGLPCATSGPPIGTQIINWIATADPANFIAETNEANNATRQWPMCDDI